MNHPYPPQVWPVIHIAGLAAARRNAEIAKTCGCTGVFVIDMDGSNETIDEIALDLKRGFPALKVGINYLGVPVHLAVARSLALGMDATWSDEPGVRSDGVMVRTREAVMPALQDNPGHLFFASVAFKYARVDVDPAAAARAACALGMIPTTSGLATGVAPDARKLQSMRAAIGDAPLAVASGINVDNAFELGRFLTHVLVATGISSSFYEFDEALLGQLMVRLGG